MIVVGSIFCPACRQLQPVEHSWCVRCGEALPTHLIDSPKRTRWFAGVPVAEGDPAEGFLRVSCYLHDVTVATEDGSVTVPGRHVRFSVWDRDRARCVLSLPEGEARDLAAFVFQQIGPGEPSDDTPTAPASDIPPVEDAPTAPTAPGRPA